MIEKDYIMRLLRQFFDALNELLFNIRKNDAQKAEFMIEALYDKFLNQKRVFFHNSNMEAIEHFIFNNDKQISLAKSEMLAELLYVDGLLAASNRRHLMSKALNMFEHVEKHSDVYSAERIKKINSIKNELDNGALS